MPRAQVRPLAGRQDGLALGPIGGQVCSCDSGLSAGGLLGWAAHFNLPLTHHSPHLEVWHHFPSQPSPMPRQGGPRTAPGFLVPPPTSGFMAPGVRCAAETGVASGHSRLPRAIDWGAPLAHTVEQGPACSRATVLPSAPPSPPSVSPGWPGPVQTELLCFHFPPGHPSLAPAPTP